VLVALSSAAATAGAETIRLDADQAAARAAAVSDLAAAAAHRRDAAAAGVQAADAGRLPLVSATASAAYRSSVPEYYLPAQTPTGPALVLIPDIREVFVASLAVGQTLYRGGGVDGARERARHDLTAFEAESSRTAADLTLAGRLGYWDAVQADALLVAARARLARAERLQTDTEALLAAGMAVRADVLAAVARAAEARVEVIRAEAAVRNANDGLRSLLHLGADDTIELADSLTRLPVPPADLASLSEQALASRPELTTLAARADALAAGERVARAPARPSVGVSAQWDLANPNGRYFPPEASWQDSWSVGVAAGWTLFDGGQARSEAATAAAGRRALVAERAELERAILLEVSTARTALDSALAAAVAADAAHAAALAREEAERERHDAGLATIVEILDAHAGLADAEVRRVIARGAAWIAAARIERAVGS
jgi:OMF family outer membrane factor